LNLECNLELNGFLELRKTLKASIIKRFRNFKLPTKIIVTYFSYLQYQSDSSSHPVSTCFESIETDCRFEALARQNTYSMLSASSCCLCFPLAFCTCLICNWIRANSLASLSSCHFFAVNINDSSLFFEKDNDDEYSSVFHWILFLAAV